MNTFIEVPASLQSLSARKPVYSVGINDASYNVVYVTNEGKSVRCPYHTKWREMLRRCYSASYRIKHPTYLGCTVAKEWLRFSTFRAWMKTQVWEGLELDKDLLVLGNKIYSPNTCVFVTSAINKLLNCREASSGKYPVGVYRHVARNKTSKYAAKCNIRGVRKFLGYFDAVGDAQDAYSRCKKDHVLDIASEQVEPLRSALMRRADLIRTN